MLAHDSAGFLIGDVVPDIRRMSDNLTSIRRDIAAIKRAVTAQAAPDANSNANRAARSRSDDARVGPAPVEPRSRRRPSPADSVDVAGTRRARQRPAPNREPIEPSTTRRRTAAPLLRDERGRFIANAEINTTRQTESQSAPVTGNTAPSPQVNVENRIRPANSTRTEEAPAQPRSRRRRSMPPEAQERAQRDARGRFTSNNSDAGDDEERRQRRLFAGMGEKIADAVSASASGLEEADPTVKAFNEIAEPLTRGYQFFMGGDRDERWYRKLFGELRLFRKDQSIFNQAEQRTLRDIDENTEAQGGSGDSGGSSFLGGLLGGITPAIMAALSAVAGVLLSGLTATLGVVFGPVGLAIGAASAAAWGLFTEDGRKFFAQATDKLQAIWTQATDSIKVKWDEGVKAFAEIWEPISKFFADKFGIVSDAAKNVVSKVAETADAGNAFIKDKTGINVKAGVSRAARAVNDSVVTPVTDFVKSGTASVKAAPKKMRERWDEAKQYLGDAAIKAGVDPGIVAKIAGFESGFNAEARPVRKRDGKVLSSAHGYGQFLDSTWVDMVRKHGEKYGIANAGDLSKADALKLRSNKDLQASLLAEFTKANIEKGRQYGAGNDDANVYALHNLGAGDGQKFLRALKRNPQAKISDILSAQVISGNKSLYGDGSITLADAYTNMAAAMARNEGFAKDIRLPTAAPMPAQVASTAAPSLPPLPKPQVIAEAPPMVVPMAGGLTPKSLSISLDKGDVGQDVSDRRIAHIVTGGLSA